VARQGGRHTIRGWRFKCRRLKPGARERRAHNTHRGTLHLIFLSREKTIYVEHTGGLFFSSTTTIPFSLVQILDTC
jgi:hypothetical protein